MKSTQASILATAKEVTAGKARAKIPMRMSTIGHAKDVGEDRGMSPVLVCIFHFLACLCRIEVIAV
jgi:hypothetical protein